MNGDSQRILDAVQENGKAIAVLTETQKNNHDSNVQKIRVLFKKVKPLDKIAVHDARIKTLETLIITILIGTVIVGLILKP